MRFNNEPVIETRGLTRVFGTFTAVNHIDLVVRPGTFFGFLGPNGAGKSTTIKMLTGLIRASAGSASILGHDIASDPVQVKQRIGVVPEELALFDRLTGPEYLSFVGRMYGLDRATIKSRSDELLEVMDLGDRKRLVVDYSHGMKKKLAISAALIHEPQLLFLDEPFEGIDAVSSRLIKDILASLVARNVTIFLTSHILEIVERLCTEVAIIHRGSLVAQGSLAELRQSLQKAAGGEAMMANSLEELFLEVVGGNGSDSKRSLSWLR